MYSAGEKQTLLHVLPGCRYALAQSRFTWRHNHDLVELCHEIRLLPARRCPPVRRNKCRTPRKHLDNANDWEIAADLEGLRHYLQVLRESGRRCQTLLLANSVPNPATICSRQGGLMERHNQDFKIGRGRDTSF